MAAEVQTKTLVGIIPQGHPGGTGGATSLWRNVIFVKGTSAANNDFITCTGMATVEGAFLISTTGVVGTMTFATNVITITNGSTLVWTGLAWGF